MYVYILEFLQISQFFAWFIYILTCPVITPTRITNYLYGPIELSPQVVDIIFVGLWGLDMVDEVKPKVNRQRDSLKYRLYPLFAITDSKVQWDFADLIFFLQVLKITPIIGNRINMQR